jgi:hypothetical protein
MGKNPTIRHPTAGNAWHGVAIRRTADTARYRKHRHGGQRFARQAWIGYAPHEQGAAGNAAKRRDTCARQAWLPKARPDQPWTGRQRSVRVVWLDPSRQVRQRVVRQSRSGLASQVKAGMVLLVQARQARPRWSRKGFKSRQALCHCQSAA